MQEQFNASGKDSTQPVKMVICEDTRVARPVRSEPAGLLQQQDNSPFAFDGAQRHIPIVTVRCQHVIASQSGVSGSSETCVGDIGKMTEVTSEANATRG
jgi:hypothetical protein